jgi:hypothetical protein
MHNIRDVAVNEDFPWLKPCNDIGWHPAVGTSDPEKIRPLLGGKPVEKRRVRFVPTCRPLSISP